jgi:hypothetical protein
MDVDGCCVVMPCSAKPTVHRLHFRDAPVVKAELARDVGLVMARE